MLKKKGGIGRVNLEDCVETTVIDFSWLCDKCRDVLLKVKIILISMSKLFGCRDNEIIQQAGTKCIQVSIWLAKENYYPILFHRIISLFSFFRKLVKHYNSFLKIQG